MLSSADVVAIISLPIVLISNHSGIIPELTQYVIAHPRNRYIKNGEKPLMNDLSKIIGNINIAAVSKPFMDKFSRFPLNSEMFSNNPCDDWIEFIPSTYCSWLITIDRIT